MRKNDFEDDGRTIADMSGVGRPALFTFRKPLSRNNNEGDDTPDKPELTKKQSRMYITGALLAAMVIAGVFIAAGAIAIAVMLFLWK